MCRSFLHPWKNKKGEYETYGRSNLGVISLNLPYIALQSKTLEEFYTKLGDMIDFVSKEQYKIATTIANSSIDIAPILYKYGVLSRYKKGKIEKTVGNRRASISIGYMGIAEVVERFGIAYATIDGQKLGLEVLKFMFERTELNKEKYNIALSLYGTPAESLTTKFAKACKDFPVIPRVNDRPEITNSYHIPVDTPINAFDKIEFEAAFQKYSTGGFISYVEVPDIRKNPEVVLTLMEFIYHTIAYCEINTTSCSKCFTCGFEGEITLHKEGHCSCPNCGETNPKNLLVVLRTCGYMGLFQMGHTIGRWFNLMNRVKHL